MACSFCVGVYKRIGASGVARRDNGGDGRQRHAALLKIMSEARQSRNRRGRRIDEINGSDYITLCNQRVSEMQRALNNRAIFVSFDDDEDYLHDVLEEEDPEYF